MAHFCIDSGSIEPRSLEAAVCQKNMDSAGGVSWYFDDVTSVWATRSSVGFNKAETYEIYI